MKREAGQTMRFLVLDDHDGFRDEMVSILERNGHQAEGVATADAAVPLVETGQYDMVLVDYSMPEHDGAWFMKHANRPRSTKALLVTAHVNRQMIETMFNAGVSGYIIKPFDEEELLHHLAFYTDETAQAASHAPAEDSGGH